MPRLVLSALLEPFKGGVRGKISEFPEVQATSWSVDGLIAKLRERVSRRLRGVQVEQSCSGEPLSPVPKSMSDDLAMPLAVQIDPNPLSTGASKPQP